MSLKKILHNISNAYTRFANGEWGNVYYLVVLALLAVWVFVLWLGNPQLVSWDEAIYASVARNIFYSGDLFNLEFNCEPYFNKPPLYIYLTTLGYHVFGINEFSARIVSALFGIATVMATFLFTKKVIGTKEAILSALLLLSNFHFISIVRHGRMESMVTFLILIAVIAFYNMKKNPKWVYLFAMATAMAALTKGLMGLFPLVIAGIFMLCKPSRLKLLLNLHTLWAVTLFMLITVPWFLIQYLNYGKEYTDHFFGFQTLQRITDALEGHKGSWWYYFERISVFYFSPWSVLIIPALLLFIWKTIRLKKDILALFTLYSLSILLIFSFIIKTKLHWYITSAYVPFAVITAYMLSEIKGKWQAIRHLLIIVSLVYILMFPFIYPSNDKKGIKNLKEEFGSQGENFQTLYSNRIGIPLLHYYSGVKIKHVQLAQIPKLGKTGENYFLLLKSQFNELPDDFEYTLIKKSGAYIFFKTTGEDDVLTDQ
jgi:4-amino-4-deoxy-L-arabinose transferase-like glycosyltransferase